MIAIFSKYSCMLLKEHSCFWIPTEIFFPFSLEATSFAGSPAHLAVSNTGIECPVTFLAVSITSLTDNAFIMK